MCTSWSINVTQRTRGAVYELHQRDAEIIISTDASEHPTEVLHCFVFERLFESVDSQNVIDFMNHFHFLPRTVVYVTHILFRRF